jgi:ABC-type transporter Mla subunit MlaD
MRKSKNDRIVGILLVVGLLAILGVILWLAGLGGLSSIEPDDFIYP